MHPSFGEVPPWSLDQVLNFPEEIVGAVQEGRFQIWSAGYINEGIEILTGIKAGQRRADGSFEEETIGYRIDQRLQALAEIAKSFGKER